MYFHFEAAKSFQWRPQWYWQCNPWLHHSCTPLPVGSRWVRESLYQMELHSNPTVIH